MSRVWNLGSEKFQTASYDFSQVIRDGKIGVVRLFCLKGMHLGYKGKGRMTALHEAAVYSYDHIM